MGERDERTRALSGAGQWIEGALERTVIAAARRPRRTLAYVALVTVGFALGLLRLRFETGILDWLPRNHPNVRAFSRVLAKLDGITNQELLWVELDPEKASRAGVETVFEQTSIRAQQELIDHVRARVPRIQHAFGLPHWFAILNQAHHGGDAAHLRLPDSPIDFELYWRILWTANRTLIDPTISADGQGTYIGLVIEGNPMSRLARDVGHEVAKAIEEYKADPDRRYDLFRHDLLVPVGLASGTSYMDRRLRSDVLRILPLAIAFLVASLILAFRVPYLVGIGIGMVLLGVIWTYGLMGFLDVPLNIVNVALVPLLFGCGVDYAIHILNEFAHVRSRGLPRDAVLRITARTSGVGVVLTTVTTVAGLLALVLSDIPGMVQLGLFASFGMLGLAFLAVTFLPAALVLRKERAVPAGFDESRTLGRIMGALGRRRALAIVVFLGVTGLFGILAAKPVYLMDVIEGNYRPDEPMARAVNRMKEQARGAFPEIVIMEGDLTKPEATEAVECIKRRLTESPTLSGKVSAASFADAIGAHEILADGASQAVPAYFRTGGNLAKAIPPTPEGVRESLIAMNRDPAWRPISSLFVDQDGSIGLILLLVGEGWDGLDGAGRLWQGIEASIEDVGGADLRLSFLGYRSMSYLFVRHSLHWLRVLFLVSFAVALGLIALFLRDRRALIAVGALMLTTGIWWLGLLHLRGIYVSVFLLFPLIFIVCIGSDYGLHLCWRLSRGEPRERVYRTTGKAILFSAVTDGGVFALFSLVGLVSASQVMEAVVLAVLAVFAATVILVPAAFGAGSRCSIKPG